MSKKKWIVCSLCILSCTLQAGTPTENTPETTETTPSQDIKQIESPSTFDRIVETIAEAAKSSPDYGKDLADR